jgi:hypothetical protein
MLTLIIIQSVLVTLQQTNWLFFVWRVVIIRIKRFSVNRRVIYTQSLLVIVIIDNAFWFRN